MHLIRNYATLNINCLRSLPKQQLLRSFIYNNDIDVLLLQELNIEANRGTTIIYRSGLPIKQSELHPSGRILSILTEANELIVNVYLPSGTNNRTERERVISDDLPFYLRHKYNMLILGGDFNNVLNAKDQLGAYNPSPGLKRICEDLQLLDSWEVCHGNYVEFTFYRGNSASRIDKIYVSKQHKEK
ncbi:hypothetical protein ANN_03993 [Periplaneta americana]|uniref:Endonuclease/exonuclease/phosphatase domain-containing protein n=1 Tax=Periplaneta americana TaxID=6978 RepID=A0ABQ8T7C2_PERAM|nr:hypothetical protein ANN_03993 [Periplaneta americana]